MGRGVLVGEYGPVRGSGLGGGEYWWDSMAL